MARSNIGYQDICKTPERTYCFRVLNYQRYHGKKGYFETEKPAKSDSILGIEYLPVILETGERWYYMKKQDDELFGQNAPFVSIEAYNRVRNISVEPLVTGSSINITGGRFKYGTEYIVLSNGVEVERDNLAIIKSLALKIGPNKENLIDLLTRMDVKHDKVREVTFISPIFDREDSYKTNIYLYIGQREDQNWLRFTLRYYGKDWLFVRRFTIAADDYRWTSSGLDRWERDHSDNVWEWIDVPAEGKFIDISQRIANANESIIRFEGQKYYHDFTVSQRMKDRLLQILALYAALKA